MLEESRRMLGNALQVSPIEAGLQTIGWLPNDIDAVHLASAVREDDVDLRPLGSLNDGREAILLGFAAVEPDEIRRAVRAIDKHLVRI